MRACSAYYGCFRHTLHFAGLAGSIIIFLFQAIVWKIGELWVDLPGSTRTHPGPSWVGSCSGLDLGLLSSSQKLKRKQKKERQGEKREKGEEQGEGGRGGNLTWPPPLAAAAGCCCPGMLSPLLSTFFSSFLFFSFFLFLPVSVAPFFSFSFFLLMVYCSCFWNKRAK